jgi:hypothetical protein
MRLNVSPLRLWRRVVKNDKPANLHLLSPGEKIRPDARSTVAAVDEKNVD